MSDQGTYERAVESGESALTGPTNLSRLMLGNFGQGFIFSLILVWSGYVIDVGWLALDQGFGAVWETRKGVTSALFMATVLGVFLGLFSGLFWSISLGKTRGEKWVRDQAEPLRAWFRSGSLREHCRRDATLFAVVLTLPVGLYLSYRFSEVLVFAIAKPHFVAGAVALAQLPVLLMSFLFFLFCRGSFELALNGLSARVPVAAFRPLYSLIVTATICVLAVVYVVISKWEVLLFLPWSFMIRQGLTSVITVSLFLTIILKLRATRTSTMSLCCAVLVILFSTGWVAHGIDHQDQTNRYVFEDDVFFSDLGSNLLVRWLDHDGDGFLEAFGGGDCDGRNAKIYPGAVDTPNNGKDEDCDGRDFDVGVIEPALSDTVHPIPDGVEEDAPVILVTICGFAAKRLKMLGGPNDPMPFLSKLAKESVVFENAFSQGPSTRLGFPALLTSRWDTEIKRGLKGKHPYPLSPTNYTMAELFRSNGYDTRAILPIKYFRRWKGLRQGFRTFDTSSAKFFNRKKTPHNADKVVNAAIRRLKNLGKSPLFMWVHFHDAHSPHKVPKGKKSRSKKRVDIYEAELSKIDGEIERFYNMVQKKFQGRAWFIVTGDHGVGFDSKRYSKKGYGYDLNTATLHVPILFHAPFLRPRRVKGLVSTMDILPTLSNLLGFKTKRVFRGVSLIPELMGRDQQRPQVLFHNFFTQERRWKKKDPLRMTSVRTPDYNLVVDRLKGRVHFWKWSEDYLEHDDLFGSDEKVDRENFDKLKDLSSAFLYRFGPSKYKTKKKKKKKKAKKKAKKKPASDSASKSKKAGKKESKEDVSDGKKPKPGKTSDKKDRPRPGSLSPKSDVKATPSKNRPAKKKALRP